jgi:uncharacterized protein with gpF-like domain
MLTRLNPELLITALENFLEAGEADARDRKLAPLQRNLAGVIASYFDNLKMAFLDGMEEYRGRFQEAVSFSEWASKLTMAQRELVEKQLGVPLEDAILEAMLIGNDDLFGIIADGGEDDAVIRALFDVVNQEAGPYAETYAASRVTQINKTTRDQLNTLITRGINEGWSYDRLAEKIADMGGFSEERARRIAVYELRDAYEGGQFKMVSRLHVTGIPMETKWQTAGDDRVSDSHRDSQAEGWQDVGYVFASGAERPPTDSGCRCTSLFRRKK